MAKFRKFVHVQTDPGGHASTVHAFQHELDMNLSLEEQQMFALDFCKLSFVEETESQPAFVMGIVHDSIVGFPDFLDHLANLHGDLSVTEEHLGQKSSSSITVKKYRDHVKKNYDKESQMFTLVYWVNLLKICSYFWNCVLNVCRLFLQLKS